MNLYNEETIELCQKTLNAEQLKLYANLCSIYSRLANIAINRGNLENTSEKSIAEQIDELYGKYLTKAVSGNLDFLDLSNNYITYKDGISVRFNNAQRNLIKKYAQCAKELSDLKHANTILISCFNKETNTIDVNSILEYNNYMNSCSDSTRTFNKFISVHTPTYIGHMALQASKNAISTIKNVDPEHIPNLSEYESKLNPASFDSQISGVKTTNQKSLKCNNLFNIKNIVTFANSPINSYSLHTYTVSELNKLTISRNSETNYKLSISNDTQDNLYNIADTLESLESSGTIPTYQQFNSLFSNINASTSDIISDLTINALKEKYPNSTSIKIDLNFEKMNPAEEYVNATITTQNGSEINHKFNHISSIDLTENITNSSSSKKSIENAQYIEQYKEQGNTLNRMLASFYSNSASNVDYNEKNKLAKEILSLTNEYYRNLDQLAFGKFELHCDNSLIRAVLPPKI